MEVVAFGNAFLKLFRHKAGYKISFNSNIIKSEASLMKASVIGTAEWQHGHKTVAETFSHIQ